MNRLRQGIVLAVGTAMASPWGLQAATKTQTFQVSVTIVGECTVLTTANLSFGTNVGATFDSPIDANTSVNVTCALNTPYAMAMNAGSFGTMVERRMQSGANQLGYQLYRESTHTTVWGDGSGGTQVVSATGTGTAQTHTVYGRLPKPSTTPPPGVYTDIVTVTLTY